MMVLCCIALVVVLSPGDEHLTPSEELYRQATMLYDAQRYQEALERFQEVRAEEPYSPIGCQSMYWSAECMYSLGRYAEAASTLRDPRCEGVWDRGRALSRLGWSLFKLGDFRDAAQAFETAAGVLSGERRLRALYMAAESSLETGEAAEARALYRRVADEFPGTGEAGQAQFMIAESLYKQEMYADAAQAYQRFIDTYPDHDYTDDAVYGLAWAQFKQGRREDAAAEFNRLASKWPRSPLASEALYRLGEARYWAERYQEAIDSFSRVDPGSDFAAPALYWTGWARFRLGEYRPAAVAFTAVRTEHPYSELCPDAQFRAGECYLLDGDLHEACSAYRIVEDFYAESDLLDDALYGLTQCHKSLGDREAVDRYRGRILSMTRSPFRAEVLFDRATEDFNEQRFRRAASGFLQLAQEHPGHPIAAKAQLRGGMALFKADDFEAARAAFLRVQTSWPRTPEAREACYRAAWSLFSKGRFVQAEVEFLAVSRDTASPWRCDALYRSGDCLYNRGLYRDAAARYRQVVTCEGASRSLLASAHNSLAWCHLESGERLEAAGAFALVMREFPGTAHWEDSAFKLAELRREMGDTAAAQEAFVQIAENEAGALWGNAAHELVLLERERANHDAALAWAERLTGSVDPALRDEGERLKIELLVTLGRRGEARQLCREVLATERAEEVDRSAHYWLGRIAWDEKDWVTSSRSFAAAAQSGAGLAEDYLWWAKSLVMTGDDATASSVAEEAAARAPDAAARRSVPLEMGRAYREVGRTDDAVKEFLKVAILHPLTREAREALLLTAETYERTGDAQKARASLEELVEKHPQSAEAGEARQRLNRLQP